MSKSLPLTDADWDRYERWFSSFPDPAVAEIGVRAMADLREARRLLRAVLWTDCNLAVDEHQAVEAYLAACDGKRP